MSVETLVPVAALVFSGAVTAWVSVPLVMQLLGITRTWYRVAAVPREELFVSKDPLPPAIFTELQQLGFEPCGMLWSICWFTGPLLVWAVRSRVFYSAEHQSFASVFRLARAEEPRIVFRTYFTDKAMVVTCNYGMAAKTDQSDFIRQCIVTGDLREQLEIHQEAVSRLAPGRERAAYRGLETLVTAEKAHDRRVPADRRVALYFLWRYLPAFLVGLVILIVVEAVTARAFGEPFEVRSSTMAISSLATAALLLKIYSDILGLVAAQRKHEVALAADPATANGSTTHSGLS
jgi:hypothetical protein